MTTTKQVAADIRKTLDLLTKSGHLKFSNGTEIQVPAGLGFTVRASKTGVSITIEDRGWIDQVTGGDRNKISEHKQERNEIQAEVDKIRGMYTPELPGTTKWGMVVLSARMTTTSREGTQIGEDSHYNPRLYCDGCRTEILRGEPKHQVAGRTPGRVDTLCDPCNRQLLAIS